MATASRHEDTAVVSETASPEIEWALREEAYAFEFFQAVRLLTSLLPDRQPVGRFSDPKAEAVRFGAATEIGFPPSQIADLDWPKGSQPRMHVNFMGLTGPQGVLPLYYSTLIRERLRARDGSMRDFLDIFNHRIISLFYQAWERHHFSVGYERGESDSLSPHLMDLIGLGTPRLAGRQKILDEAFLFRCGLLATHCRSAAGLRALLMDYFEVTVEIEEFIGGWYPIDESTQCRFGSADSDSEKLGFGTVVGDEIWDQQSCARILLGPLKLNQYLAFLPGGTAHEPLCTLVRFFAGNELDFEVKLILRKEELPPCELGGEGATAPRLGWLTWAITEPPSRDPDETILRI